jgi:dUTP pyrophosphatase
MSLQVTRLTDNAILPSRGTPGAAGLDLYSADGYVVMPGHRVVVSTGISVKLPVGTYGRVAPRSGLAAKHGLDVLAGVIDPDYQGELKVVLVNTDLRVRFSSSRATGSPSSSWERHVPATVEEVFEPGEITERGDGGFESTGIGYKVTGV